MIIQRMLRSHRHFLRRAKHTRSRLPLLLLAIAQSEKWMRVTCDLQRILASNLSLAAAVQCMHIDCTVLCVCGWEQLCPPLLKCLLSGFGSGHCEASFSTSMA